jgi:hypothetical protein
MKTYLVQLEDHDDVISARDKISWSKASRVLLIWPRKGWVLERKVDLLLLMRHAQQQGAQMAIVTRSKMVIDHARELGIPVFASPLKAQRSAWRKPPALLRQIRPVNPLQSPQVLREQRAELAVIHTASLLSPQKPWLNIAVFSSGILAFLLLVLFFFPNARIILSPERRSQDLTIPVWASPSIETPNPSGGMPAKVIRVVVEGSDQTAATGRILIPDQFASGQVQLTNLTDQPLDVPEGSVVLSIATPTVRYTTTKAVQVPALPGKPVLVPIRALAAGQAGNLAAGQIRAMEGATGLRLEVENLEAVSGGKDRSGPSPTKTDYQKLRQGLLTELEATALDELRGQVKEGQQLLPTSLHQRTIVEESQNPAAGQPADQLQLTMRVEYEAWLVQESDAQAVALAALQANAPAGFRQVPGSLSYSFQDAPAYEPGVGEEPGSVRWTLAISRSLEAGWNEADIIRATQGHSVRSSLALLHDLLKLSAPPRIEVNPSWWGWMPFLPVRIQVVQQ